MTRSKLSTKSGVVGYRHLAVHRRICRSATDRCSILLSSAPSRWTLKRHRRLRHLYNLQGSGSARCYGHAMSHPLTFFRSTRGFSKPPDLTLGSPVS
jgi:hypothetical protein